MARPRKEEKPEPKKAKSEKVKVVKESLASDHSTTVPGINEGKETPGMYI